MSEASYPGGELELFARAENWKRYFVSEVAPFLKGRVLEVGSGIGETARAFGGRPVTSWTCLEPDPEYARHISGLVARGELPSRCTSRCGTLHDLDPADTFDSILYIDVLEHIEDDTGELHDAAGRLAHGGHLIVLSPAHQWLYSAFDEAIGHHRRYSESTLRGVAPPGLELVSLRYLDSVGLLASAANRLVLKQSEPTLREILLWDRFMVRASTWIDPLLSHRLGKSLLGVWRQPS